MRLLLIQRFGVGLRQTHQVASCAVHQKCAEKQAEQQESTDQRRGDRLGGVAMRSTRASFVFDQVVELSAHVVDQLASTIGSNVFDDRQAFATPFDAGLGEVPPLLQQHFDPLDPPKLQRIFTHLLPQLGHATLQHRQAVQVGLEKHFLTGDQIAAHAAFQVDQDLEGFMRHGHFLHRAFGGVVDVEQVVDDGTEEERAEETEAERQADIAIEDASETLLIDRGVAHRGFLSGDLSTAVTTGWQVRTGGWFRRPARYACISGLFV